MREPSRRGCLVQVKVLPISDRFYDKAEEIKNNLEKQGIRAEADWDSEKIGYKIREAQLEKVNYMLIIGEKEIESSTVSSVRAQRATSER